MSGGSAVTRLSDAPYEPSPTVASEVRRALRELLAGWGLSEQVLTDALLIVRQSWCRAMEAALPALAKRSIVSMPKSSIGRPDVSTMK